MFEEKYMMLFNNKPEFGQIALIPWDTESFGFGVANYNFDQKGGLNLKPSQLRSELERWSRTNEVEIIGTSISAMDLASLNQLQNTGFRYIDTSLDLRYERIQSAKFLPLWSRLEPMTQADLHAVSCIADTAFQNGRYHADPCFPNRLADKRYRDWVQRTCDPQNAQLVLVARNSVEICGFSIVDIHGDCGYYHLMAAAPHLRGSPVGLSIGTSTMRYFQQKGVNLVRSKISAINTPVLNLHAFLGASFNTPRIIMHLHLPWSKHLNLTF